MLLVKYKKINQAAYMSHLDVLKSICFTIRRSGLNVQFSLGHHPHMLLNLSAPTPIGVQSVAEYFFVDSNAAPDSFKTEYNAVCSENLQILSAVQVTKNPNIVANAFYANYKIDFKNAVEAQEKAKLITQSASFIMPYIKQDKQMQKEIRPLIHSVKNTQRGIDCVLSLNPQMLRADHFANVLGESTSIIKLSQLDKQLQCI